MQYRVSFLIDLIATASGAGITFLTLALILQKFDSVGGWRLGEVAFLYGMVETAFGCMDLFFSGFDAETFASKVREGEFDKFLLRPIPVTLQVLGSEFVLRRIGRIVQGALILGIAIGLVHANWTLFKVLYLPVVLLSLVAFFGGLFIIGATITFFTQESIEAMNIFTYGGTEMMSYPMHIYETWMVRFFTFVVPAIFIVYYPALYFLDKPDPFGLPFFARFLSPFAGLVLLGAALFFWRYGVQHYQSTGT